MPLTESNTWDYYANDLPKCPFCDSEIDLIRHDLSEMHEEGEHEFDCPYCEKTVTVSVSVSFSFTTTDQPEPEKG